MTKKYISILAALAVALSFTACSSGNGQDSTSSDSAGGSNSVDFGIPDDFGDFSSSSNAEGFSGFGGFGDTWDNGNSPDFGDNNAESTPAAESAQVYRKDIGDGQLYTGCLVNGVPNGSGELKFDIDLLDSKVLKVGSFKDGQLSGNGRTLNISKDSHLFCVGEYVDDVLSGSGYMEHYLKFPNDQYVSDQYYGEFKNGNLVSGEKFHHNVDKTFLFDIGSFYQADNGIFLSDGYEIVYDRSGNILSCSSFSNGVEQSLTHSQFSEITELQSYDVEYIVNVILARYGYEDSFNEMKTALSSYDNGDYGNSADSGNTGNTDNTSANEPILVRNEDIGDGRIYSGYLVNGVPNGDGELRQRFDNGWNLLEIGKFEDGKISGNGRIMQIKGENYFFAHGKFTADMLSGYGYEEDCFIEDLTETHYRIGTFLDGNLVEGEHLTAHSDSSSLLKVGAFNDYKLHDGYELKFDRSGNLVSLSKLTNGKEQKLSPKQISEISELQKYNADYIDKAISTHYDYGDSFKEMKTALGF